MESESHSGKYSEIVQIKGHQLQIARMGRPQMAIIECNHVVAPIYMTFLYRIATQWTNVNAR